MRDLADTLLVSATLENRKHKGQVPPVTKLWRTAVLWLSKRGFSCEVADKSRAPYQWTAEPMLRAENGAHLLHEYAHFCVCPKYRLLKPGFGLGFEYLGTGGKKDLTLAGDVTFKQARVEELRVSMLGALIERSLDMHWFRTLGNHNWLYEGNWTGVPPDRVLTWLHRRQFIFDDGTPHVLPRYRDRIAKGRVL